MAERTIQRYPLMVFFFSLFTMWTTGRFGLLAYFGAARFVSLYLIGDTRGLLFLFGKNIQPFEVEPVLLGIIGDMLLTLLTPDLAAQFVYLMSQVKNLFPLVYDGFGLGTKSAVAYHCGVSRVRISFALMQPLKRRVMPLG